LLAPSSPH